jgi:hypothetical protein
MTNTNEALLPVGYMTVYMGEVPTEAWETWLECGNDTWITQESHPELYPVIEDHFHKEGDRVRLPQRDEVLLGFAKDGRSGTPHGLEYPAIASDPKFKVLVKFRSAQ